MALWLWDPHGPTSYDLLFKQFSDQYVERPAFAAAAQVLKRGDLEAGRICCASPLIYKRDVPTHAITWFPHAIVGQSKRTTWYQYGFGEPQVSNRTFVATPCASDTCSPVIVMVSTQGPLPGKRVDGRDVRAVADYLVDRMVPATDLTSKACIVLFRRTLNRRILNEAQLISALQHHYGLPVEVGCPAWPAV